MQKRRFGRTDLEVSVIGLGTWPMGGARYGRSNDTDAKRAIAAALDAGVTCFDTAPSYGNGHAEELLGKALEGRRDNVILVTKGGLVWNEKSEVLRHDGSLEHLSRVLDDSLRRLRTDCVDLYLIHWPDKDMPAARTAEALQTLLESGRTRYIGVSNYTGPEFHALADALGNVPLVANQVSFHLFDRRWERSAFETCQRLGAGVMAYGALAHGLLTGMITRSTALDTTDWRASGLIFGQPLLTRENRQKTLGVVDRLAKIADGAGMTLPQLALRWVLAHPAVTVALVGARTSAEILEAADASSRPLDASLVRQIGATMAGAVGVVPTLTA